MDTVIAILYCGSDPGWGETLQDMACQLVEKLLAGRSVGNPPGASHPTSLL